ncbi:sporulation integral membrane protein YlbJ [Paenibacillus sp. GD4]|jgi:sporulation integral membrane protein YlbJ|uniref:sporulation integral membrane protein YlbJ n=1 Tax=Paenibacillus sp. GD4 TaxID=3068890 RepID=UPI00279659B3|nr:sporulation integral membrane protein YlbJ [Paenibacillus sp. GD4]MDQ1912000.1 sporulation integral membrane protein YlbJ [Paenibacillus sp. GD4]
MRKSNAPALAVAALAVALAVMMLMFPAESFHASIKGIVIWWDVLFPALFPFFVISEMMLGVGLVHFFGTLFDPLMRPLFRIPGIGGFVMAMGFASGYPVGAKLTSRLWENRLVNREEGERLVSFTTSSDPIFLIGAVSVGFFHDQALAVVLGAAHYGGALLVGFLMRFHGKASPGNHVQEAVEKQVRKHSLPKNIWLRAFEAMHEARMQDGRTLGKMLQQAVGSGLQLIFVVGGLVVFFSVVMEVMTSGHIMGYLYILINSILQFVGMPLGLSQAVANGIFEVTLGAKAAGGAEGVPLVYKAAIAAWVLSWAGLSVHAQVVSILHHTNLRYLPFVLARILHSILAGLLVLLLWEPLTPYSETIAALVPKPDVTTPVATFWTHTVPIAGLGFLVVLGCLLLLSLLVTLGKRCMKWN